MRKIAGLAVLVILLTGFSVNARQEGPLVFLLTADGAVAPPMVEYLERGLEQAVQSGAELVILQLNTPGGSIDAMTDMVQVIRLSEVPVVVYVRRGGRWQEAPGR